MYKFGTIPPLSPATFGVTGVLGEGCRVYHEIVYSTKHVGRLCDLLAAQLRGQKPDELRLRLLLTFSVFEAYLQQTAGADGVVPESIVVECGIDKEKIAIAIAMTLSAAVISDLDGLPERVDKSKPANPFERIVAHLRRHGHRVLVRVHKDSGRVEIVSLLGLEGKIDRAELAKKPSVLLIPIGERNAEPPLPGEYVALGDLNYPMLLREDVIPQVTPQMDRYVVSSRPVAPPEGKISVKNSVVGENDVVKVAGSAVENDAVSIAGSAVVDGDNVRIQGVTDRTSDEKIVVKAGVGAPKEDKTEIRFEADQESEEQNEVIQVAGQKQKTKGRKFNVLTSEKSAEDESAPEADENVVISGTTDTAAQENTEFVISESEASTGENSNEPMIIAGSGEQQRHEAEVSKYLAQIRSLQQQLSESRKNADKRVKGEDDKFVVPGMAEVADANEVADATDEPSRTGGDSDVAKVSDDLLEAIENGALKTMINRVQGEADELANESADNKARRLVNNLMGDLVSEKSRLNEMAKQLSLSIRQKEHRFQSREAGLREELKRKEEVIRLKDAAIVHHKEQLAQNASMLERLRGAKNSASEDQVLKQQLTVAQNTVNTMKDENKRLQRKLEELRAASAAVTSGGGKGRAQTPEEFNELKTKHDRAIKQVDEFKKVNAQLMQRLDASKKDKGTNVAVVEDLKKKLEAAVNLANNSKKDTERFVARADSLQKEEQRLRSELNKALEEVKKLKLEKAQAAIARPKSGTPAPGTPHGAAAAPASGTGTGSGTGSGTGGTPAAAA